MTASVAVADDRARSRSRSRCDVRVRARAAKLTPARYLQQLLRQDIEDGPREFSARFAALAGSWEDDRPAADIVRDIDDNRIDAERPEMM
jgi:hypothetical protein